MKQSLDVDSALGDCEARLLRDLREGNSQTPLRRLGTTVVSFDKALIGAVRRSALSGFAADAEIDQLLSGPGLSECAEARRLKSGEAFYHMELRASRRGMMMRCILSRAAA